MIKAVIFDIDGTLIDTEPMYWAAWRSVFAPYGITITDDEMRTVMGMLPVEGGRSLADRFGVDTDPAELTEQLIEIAVNIPERTLMPGAVRALDLVRSAGIAMTVATSATMRMATASLKGAGLADYFDFVVSAEYEPYGKPHPGVFLTAAERLGVDPLECVVVEDAPSGVIAAKAARMFCVAVPEPGHRDDKRIAIADVVLDSLDDFTLDTLPN